MLGVIVDGLIIVLLLVVLGFGVMLHRRLARLRAPGSELQGLIEALDAATSRAESVLSGFTQGASESSAAIARERERVVSLIDDLRLLTERSEREADRLTNLISEARPMGPNPARPTLHEPPEARAVRDPAELERTLRSLR